MIQKLKSNVKNALVNNGLRYITVNKDNHEFVKKVISQSGFSWHELYYVNSNLFQTCLHITEFMEESYSNFMDRIINKPYVFPTLDMSSLSTLEYKNRYDKILDQVGDEMEETTKASVFADGREDIVDLNEFNREMKEEKDRAKEITIRIYIYACTFKELQDNLDEVINDLIDLEMEAKIQTNDLKGDVKALTSFSNPIRRMVRSETVADFMHRSIINRIDEDMPLLGYTEYGIMAPNTFSYRYKAWNIMFVSGMGGGKSAAFKSLLEGRYLKDLTVTIDKETREETREEKFIVHILDSHDEYVEIAEKLKWQNVEISKDHHINPMQIFHVESEVDDIIREIDITNIVSMIVSLFDDYTQYGRNQTLDTLTSFLIPYFNDKINHSLSSFTNDDWCILKQPYDDACIRLESGKLNKEEMKDFSNIKTGLNKMITAYGFMLNEKTNMQFDLTRSTRFDVSFLRNNKDQNVRSGYISLIQNYLTQAMQINMKRNQEALRELGIPKYKLKEPIFKYFVLVDETLDYSSNSFYSNSSKQLKYARKADSAMGYVIHSTSDTKENMTRFGSQIAELFKLCNHKFIGATDSMSLDDMKKDNMLSVLTDEDISIISSFEKGDNDERSFLYVDDKNIKTYFTTLITEFQRSYYRGGN